MTAEGRDVTESHTGRKASVNSFFWQAPDRILLIEYLGGGSAISDLNATEIRPARSGKVPREFTILGIFQTSLYQRMARSRPRCGVLTIRHRKFSPDRSANGAN